MKITFYLTAILLLLPFLGKSQALKPELANQINALIQDKVEQDEPGLALGVVQNGNVAFESYRGCADLKSKTSIDRGTRFNIASNAKQFTALCILRLAAAQQLNLDDDVRQYLPGLLPGIKAPITLRQMLNHSSGIRDVYGLWDLQGITWWKENFSNQDALDLLMAQRELNFPPGSQHLYSNSNYILLAFVVEKITGKPFTAYSDELFEVLGMPSTHFEDQHLQIQNYAYPYGGWKKWERYPWNSDLVGDGALFSTLRDQMAWEVIVQTESHPKISTPLIQASQSPIPNVVFPGYGHGISFWNYRGIPCTFHDGNTGAWNASFVRFPARELSIVAVSNNGKVSPYGLVREVADLILQGQLTPAPAFLTAPEAEGPYISEEDMVGTYRTEGGYHMRFTIREDKLYMERYGRDAIALEREAANLVHEIEDQAWKQEFLRDSLGQMQLTAYYSMHAPFTLKRISSNWEGYDDEGVEGRYLNAETGAAFKLKKKKGFEYTISIDGSQEVAEMYSPDVLLCSLGTLNLVRNPAGQVTGILLNSNRIQQVSFQKQ